MKCLFYLLTEEPGDFSNAKPGRFMQLGTHDGDTMAFVVAEDGQIHYTWPEHVKLEESDELQQVLDAVKPFVAKTKWENCEREIVKLLTT